MAKGEMGDPGASLPMRRWKRDGFDGERESERRSCWIDEEKWAG